MERYAIATLFATPLLFPSSLMAQVDVSGYYLPMKVFAHGKFPAGYRG